jgi:DNA-directed RNA polymerase subunit RPC12/RpoP
MAWRCSSCGRIVLYDRQVPKPARCTDCGSEDLGSIHPQPRAAI